LTGSAGRVIKAAFRLASGVALLMAVTVTLGQVSPDQISDSRAKAEEQKYLAQLQSLHQSIASNDAASPFALARYLHAKPGQRAADDSNGIEFVDFQGRIVLKISGVYRSAYDAAISSGNERACQTLISAVVPVLRLVVEQIPQRADFDGIGFEVLYDTRNADAAYRFGGKEVLTIVFNRDDAFTFAKTIEDAGRQEILNRSDVFVNGVEVGLALGQREAFSVATLDRSPPRYSEGRSSLAVSNPVQLDVASQVVSRPGSSAAQSAIEVEPGPTFANAVRLQDRFQAQLDEIVGRIGSRIHFDASYPPTFEVSADLTVLHLTLYDPLRFERGATSIYKRAAQGFDLFLAPELRDLSRMLPVDEGYGALDISVLNQVEAGSTPPETVDYICPLSGLRAFVENKITSQDLINQSAVLVNGVRIGLNLEAVE